LVYHSTATVYGQYNVTVSLQGFGIFHFEKMSIYSPWRAFGDIGGVAFFLLLAHTLAMAIIGMCFTNNSSFLSKSNASGISGSIHDNEGQYAKM